MTRDELSAFVAAEQRAALECVRQGQRANFVMAMGAVVLCVGAALLRADPWVAITMMCVGGGMSVVGTLRALSQLTRLRAHVRRVNEKLRALGQ